MKKVFLKIFNYYLLFFLLLFFNEFTLSFFDKTPPLSNDAITSIRKINFFIIVLFYYIKFIYLNDNFTGGSTMFEDIV